MLAIRCLLTRGTPRLSVSSDVSLMRLVISLEVASTPRVLLLQCCESSLSEIRESSFSTWADCCISSAALAFLSSWTSSLSHSNMHADKLRRNDPASGCCSDVRPMEKRRMKCQISNLRVISHGLNSFFVCVSPDSAQQSRSTKRRCGGAIFASLYRLTKPCVIRSRPIPSRSVITELRMHPSSLPTFVHQEAVPAASPASFFVIWGIEN